MPFVYILDKEINLINYLLIFREKMNLQKNYGSICIRMRYLKIQEKPSFACVEIDFSKLFDTSSLDALEKYDFRILTYFDDIFFFQ